LTRGQDFYILNHLRRRMTRHNAARLHGCHFLARPKKWRKKADFGKPKSQVCLLAKANKQTLPRQGV
jgi:hypothetical protein